MLEKIEAAAVDRLCRDYVLSRLSERLNGVCDRRSAGSYRESCCTALESRDPLLKNSLSGVCESAVDVARVTETEAVCGVLAVMENVGSCGVNRNRSCVGCGVSPKCKFLSFNVLMIITPLFEIDVLIVFSVSNSNGTFARICSCF